MSFSRNSRPQGGTIIHGDYWNTLARNDFGNGTRNRTRSNGNIRSSVCNFDGFNNAKEFTGDYRDYSYNYGYTYNNDTSNSSHVNNTKPENAPSWKRRKFSASTWGDTGRPYFPTSVYELTGINPGPPSTSCKRDRSCLDDDEPIFMSRDDIERHSPSRKDGIDPLRETHLRYSYCAFLQNLGLRLELPQTTVGTAMVLCHRFFVRRSHACHDRFLIATAALFLAAKSEDTPRPLNNVLRVSSEIYHKQDMALLSYLLPINWLEQYRERVMEAETMILTTLNFELTVQHPYDPLTSVLSKLGFSQTGLVNLALNLVSEGLRSSLWLQFKPHHIAAGAAYLAAKFLHMDLDSYRNIWREFETTPVILQDVTQQLMELF